MDTYIIYHVMFCLHVHVRKMCRYSYSDATFDNKNQIPIAQNLSYQTSHTNYLFISTTVQYMSTSTPKLLFRSRSMYIPLLLASPSPSPHYFTFRQTLLPMHLCNQISLESQCDRCLETICGPQHGSMSIHAT